MSPPEVWGPAVWRLFHTLSERLNDNAYNALSPQLFGFFVRICKFLPCPDCSNDASIFLAKIRFSDIKNKIEFKNTFYLFHNWVNAKKRKPLFNYGNINIYSRYRIFDVLNDFYAKYQTKGNMKLLTESFQRQFVVKDFNNWQKFLLKRPCSMVILIKENDNVRLPNKIEMCRLQGFPDNYCDILDDRKAGSLLGDGWTLPIIEHIFKFIEL